MEKENTLKEGKLYRNGEGKPRALEGDFSSLHSYISANNSRCRIATSYRPERNGGEPSNFPGGSIFLEKRVLPNKKGLTR